MLLILFKMRNYNWRQNYSKLFAEKGVSDILPTQKEENKAFPSLPLQYNVVPLFELPVENSEHPNFEYRAVNIFVLRSIPFEDNLSTILTPIMVQMEKNRCVSPFGLSLTLTA